MTHFSLAVMSTCSKSRSILSSSSILKENGGYEFKINVNSFTIGGHCIKSLFTLALDCVNVALIRFVYQRWPPIQQVKVLHVLAVLPIYASLQPIMPLLTLCSRAHISFPDHSLALCENWKRHSDDCRENALCRRSENGCDQLTKYSIASAVLEVHSSY